MSYKKSLALFFCSVMLATNTVCTPIAFASVITWAVVDGKVQDVLLISGDIASGRWQPLLVKSAAWKWVAVRVEGLAMQGEGELGLTSCDTTDPQRIQAGDAPVGSLEWLKAADAARSSRTIKQVEGVEEIVSKYTKLTPGDYIVSTTELKPADLKKEEEEKEDAEEAEEEDEDEEVEVPATPNTEALRMAEAAADLAAQQAAAACCPAGWAVNAVDSVPRVASPPYEAVAKNSDEILDKLQQAIQGINLSLKQIDQFLKADSSFAGTPTQKQAMEKELRVNHDHSAEVLKRALADVLRITAAQGNTAARYLSYAKELHHTVASWAAFSKALEQIATKASLVDLGCSLLVARMDLEKAAEIAAGELARAGLPGPWQVRGSATETEQQAITEPSRRRRTVTNIKRSGSQPALFSTQA
ncbi:hypothetical protein FACS1894198_5190 [Clostridia bacterium]|nr:hypothetical protein FACS1894198_5190 [Clostridia bacterium]